MTVSGADVLEKISAQIHDVRNRQHREAASACFTSCGLDLNIRSDNNALLEVCKESFFSVRQSGQTCGNSVYDVDIRTDSSLSSDILSFIEINSFRRAGSAQTGFLAEYGGSRMLFQTNRTGQSLFFFNARNRYGFFWTSDVAASCSIQSGSPLLPILHWMASDNRRYILHAASLFLGQKCVLIGGASGQGKSTAALKGVEQGLGYMGDDCVAVCPEKLRVYPVYRSLKLSQQAKISDNSKEIFRNVNRLRNGKKIYTFSKSGDDFPIEYGVASAFLLAEYAGTGAPEISALSKAEAFRRFAPSCVYQMPGSGSRELASINKLLTQIPVHKFKCGYMMKGIGSVLVEYIKEI